MSSPALQLLSFEQKLYEMKKRLTEMDIRLRLIEVELTRKTEPSEN